MTTIRLWRSLLVETIMNQAAILTAVALGTICDDNFHHLMRIATALRELSEIDERLMRFAIEEDESGIDHTDETEDLFERAGQIIDDFPPLAAEIFLYYNDEVSEDSPGRIRLEIPGTPWDANQPLQFH